MSNSITPPTLSTAALPQLRGPAEPNPTPETTPQPQPNPSTGAAPKFQINPAPKQLQKITSGMNR